MSQLEDYKEDFILLCEAGFIAANRADEGSAQKLFEASALLDPQNTLPKVGLGYLHFLKLEVGPACDHFNTVLKEEPDNEMAKTFLGLAMIMSPDKVGEGEQILHDSAKHSKDKMARSLSCSALEFVDKFIKKEPSPVEGTKQKEKKKKGK